jgi:hypothetical protein
MCYWPSHSHALVSPRQTLQQYKVNVTSYFDSLNPHEANEIYLIRIKIRLKLAEWENLCLRKSLRNYWAPALWFKMRLCSGFKPNTSVQLFFTLQPFSISASFLGASGKMRTAFNHDGCQRALVSYAHSTPKRKTHSRRLGNAPRSIRGADL